MFIKVLDSVTDDFLYYEIPDDFEFLRVTVMTGDEIIEVYRKDPKWHDAYLYDTVDLGKSNRTRDFLDVTYIVYRDQVEVWMERGKRYIHYESEIFKRTFRGYFSTFDVKMEKYL